MIALFSSVASLYHCFLNIITSSSLIIIMLNLPVVDYFSFFILDFLYFGIFFSFKINLPICSRFKTHNSLCIAKSVHKPCFQGTYMCIRLENIKIVTFPLLTSHSSTWTFVQIYVSLKCYHLSHPNSHIEKFSSLSHLALLCELLLKDIVESAGTKVTM